MLSALRFAGFAPLAPLAVAVAWGCTSPTTSSTATSSTSSTYTPITGIAVDANSLFFAQGCGVESGQVYKYAATVSLGVEGGTGIFFATALYDCFANAVFLNVGLGVGSTLGGTVTDIQVDIDAYDKATYDTNANAIFAAISAANANAAQPNLVLADIATLDSLATFRSACTARQEPNVQSLAACDPLEKN